MLALGSRDDGRKGAELGFRSREGAMEESELEEGEAFSGHEGDDCVDPDIALSYIDEKLQDVLGHFQKDFEGGVSAENLGAKFGGYGSFLPTHQRSPSALPQPKSPLRPQNNTVSKSPYSSIECVRPNPSVLRGTADSKTSTASVAQFSHPSKKESGVNLEDAGGCDPYIDSNIKPVNLCDQKSLTVRLKVGPGNTLASNAAIYSGLGLDTSPSSSPDISPDVSTGLSSPELQDAHGGSPVSILQVMTCFSVPGGRLLSPLSEDLFELSKNQILFGRKAGMVENIAAESVPNTTLSNRDKKDRSDKKIKSSERNFRSKEEILQRKDDRAEMQKRDMGVGSSGSRSVLDISLPSCSKNADFKAEQKIADAAAKGLTLVLGSSKEPNSPFVKDKLPLTDPLKEEQCIPLGSIKPGSAINCADGNLHYTGKVNSKTILCEKDIEGRDQNNQKDISSDTEREGKIKNERSHGLSKLSGDEYNGRDDLVAHQADLVKQIPNQRVVLHEKDTEKMYRTHEGRKKHKESQKKCAPSAESIQNHWDIGASSSVISQEEKKSSYRRGDCSESKPKVLNFHKESNKGNPREYRREDAGPTNAQRIDSGVHLSEPFVEESTERSGIKKEVPPQPEPVANPVIASTTCTAPISEVVAPLDGPPVVIKENWVCCDKCQKWRLLPYGADPRNLPKKWKCRMQVWLPHGLNKCSISEDDTQKAFHALYVGLVPESGTSLTSHQGVNTSNVTSTDAQPFDQRHDQGTHPVYSVGKKKSGLIAASNVLKNSVSKKNLSQPSIKNKSLPDVGEYPVETNFSIKAGLGLAGKSVDFAPEKTSLNQKEKHGIPGHYSGGGDIAAKTTKHSKSKSKRENQEEFRTSKKIKKENADYLVEDRFSDLDMSIKAIPDMDNALSAKVSDKVLQNCSDHSSSKGSKSDQKGNFSVSIKNSKDHIKDANGDFKGRDVEKTDMLGYSIKKRKVKEWQESQALQETVMRSQHELDSRSKEGLSEGELRKQKKANRSISEGKEPSTSSIDRKTDKKNRPSKILLSGSRKQQSNGTAGGKEPSGYQESAVPRHALDVNNPVKRSMTYGQLPAAATSSSSKVSGSRKSKGNLQEARGSPVESVSSSPFRISTTEKISMCANIATKDEMVNLDASFSGSPRRSSDGELGSDQSGTLRKETGPLVPLKSPVSHKAAEYGVLGSVGGTHQLEKEASHLSGSNNKDELYLGRGATVDLLPANFERINAEGNIDNGPEKDSIVDDLNNLKKLDGAGLRKSGRSSGFKERNLSSSSDVNRGKSKDSSALSNKNELCSSKNKRNSHSEADLIRIGDSNHQEEPRDEDFNFQEKNGYLGRKNYSIKRSPFDGRGDYPNRLEENVDADYKDYNLRADSLGANCKANAQNRQLASSYSNDNPVSHSLLNHADRSDMSTVRGTLKSGQVREDKSEAQGSGEIIPTLDKGSRPDTYPIDVANGDGFKLVKQSRKADSEICLNPSSLRQVTLSHHDSSPMRKDAPNVARTALKEAIDLKHTANRLKTEGLDYESIGIYFEAVLKFLYSASLMEPHATESAKHGDMDPLLKMISTYSDTAKLCDYCAHEYERHKEMAAAALAYKCIEVAYMKVAYYKQSAACKDRHELLTALHTALPGESPSSSASDVDNLNNPGAIDKTASAKAAVSQHVTGNHVISARHRPNFMRLLGYVNDLNSAFDATKKSHNAIAAASGSLEKNGVDGLASVRKVLDFHFQNVGGLLRLVRLSVESISR